jgi:hypothetical protein
VVDYQRPGACSGHPLPDDDEVCAMILGPTLVFVGGVMMQISGRLGGSWRLQFSGVVVCFGALVMLWAAK